MRLIIFFDLPMETSKDRREYSKFRKFLINEGFVMMQKSVYTKLALNNSIINSEKDRIKKNKPSKGIVQTLIVTEKQFSNIEYIVGNNESNILDNTERMIIL